MEAINTDALIFGYWCSGQTHLCWITYRQALEELWKGESLTSDEFVHRWGSSFPWIYSKLMTDYTEDWAAIMRWLEQGIDLVVPSDPCFPSALLVLENPPTLLFGRGNWDCLKLPCLAVVGSREPSSLSLSWVETELSRFVSRQEVTIVSGGARGIDLAAHRVALKKQKPTAVLFPSGHEQLYPSQWGPSFSWGDSVIESGGILLSEYAPPIQMRKAHFLERNRLISGLSKATLVLEARLRSGTLVTARASLEQNRPVYIVPSHPYDANSRGGLDLMTEGATPIKDAEDLSLFFKSELGSNTFHSPTNWQRSEISH